MSLSDADLSSTGLRAALKILTLWNCSSAQTCSILGIPESLYRTFQIQSTESIAQLNHEQLERISYILNIYASLRLTFSNPYNVRHFMSMKNHNAPFCGKSALDIIQSGDIRDLSHIAEHICNFQIS